MSEREIRDLQNDSKGKVSTKVFFSMIAVILIGVGWAITQSSKAQDSAIQAKESVADIRGDVKAINAKLDILINQSNKKEVLK